MSFCLCWFAILLTTSAALGQTTEPWRPTADNAPTFAVLISPGVAPAVVHVNALDCPLPVGTPLTTRYDWDFGDPNAKFNTLTGFNAAHLYDHAGAYTITLTVTDQDGKVRTTTATLKITVNARKQLFVSPNGSDRNQGTSEDAPLLTLPQACKLLTDGCEIRLKAGCTFHVDSTLLIHKSDVLIGRYGPGADPVLMLEKVDNTPAARGHHGMISIDNKCNGVLIERITIDSPYGVADTEQAPKVGIDSIIARGHNISFREMTFLNVDTAINANGNPVGMLVQECKAPKKTALRAYLIWGQGSDHVYLCNQCANSTREHCIRLSSVDRVLIFGNDFTNLDRRPVDPYDYSKGTIEMHRGSYAYIAGNSATDGTIRVGPLGLHGEEASSATDWCVIENNRLVGTQILAYAGAHHIMMRNNLLFADDRNGFEFGGPGGDGRVSGDLTVVNNTVIDNGNKGSFLKTGGHVDGITLVNNLFVAGNLQLGKDGTAIINVGSDDLADFKSIAHNAWPLIAGPAFVFNKVGKTQDDWKGLPQVKADGFTDTTVDNDGVPPVTAADLKTGESQPGVKFDRSGKTRPAAHITIGAVEIPDNKPR